MPPSPDLNEADLLDGAECHELFSALLAYGVMRPPEVHPEHPLSTGMAKLGRRQQEDHPRFSTPVPDQEAERCRCGREGDERNDCRERRCYGWYVPLPGESDPPDEGGEREANAALTDVRLTLCEPCLNGDGGECHSPGCALWMNRAPDVPLRDHAWPERADEGGEARIGSGGQWAVALADTAEAVEKLAENLRNTGDSDWAVGAAEQMATKIAEEARAALADEGGGRTWTLTDAEIERLIELCEFNVLDTVEGPKIDPAGPQPDPLADKLRRLLPTLHKHPTQHTSGATTRKEGDADGQRTSAPQPQDVAQPDPPPADNDDETARAGDGAGAQQEGEERGEGFGAEDRERLYLCGRPGSLRDDHLFFDRVLAHIDAQQEEIERLRQMLMAAGWPIHAMAPEHPDLPEWAREPTEWVREALAERDRYKAGLERAADDLGKAANQFASLAAAGKPPEHNGDIFARKEAEARAALDGDRSGEGA